MSKACYRSKSLLGVGKKCGTLVWETSYNIIIWLIGFYWRYLGLFLSIFSVVECSLRLVNHA